MHSLRWVPIPSAPHLCGSFKSPQPTKATYDAHWVPANLLSTSSVATRSRSNFGRRFLMLDSGRTCSCLRHRSQKVFNFHREDDGETAPDAEDSSLSGLVEGEVEKLLKSEENQALLRDLAAATQRVNAARQDLDEIEKQEKDAAKLRANIEKLEGTDSMIADCLREVSEAEAKVRKAELALITARAGSGIQDLSNKWEEADIDEGAERIESIKALSVSAVIGTFASIPVALFQATSVQGLFIREGIIFIICALFGVTYRYTVRRNLENIQLKTGTVAAFGLVRGLSQFEAKLPVDFDVNIIFSYALDAAFMVGEGLLVFISAAIALDYCMKINLLSPFPSKNMLL